jgi:hypothetical protein
MFMFLIAGCDPGITIRQAGQGGRLNASPAMPNPGNLAISVKTTHPIIHNDWYAPDVTVTNLLPSPVTISGVELTAKGIVYTNSPKRQLTHPLVVLPGQTATLDVWFDLHEDVWKTFPKQSADLRVDYLSDGQQMTAHASIIGERLNY